MNDMIACDKVFRPRDCARPGDGPQVICAAAVVLATPTPLAIVELSERAIHKAHVGKHDEYDTSPELHCVECNKRARAIRLQPCGHMATCGWCHLATAACGKCALCGEQVASAELVLRR